MIAKNYPVEFEIEGPAAMFARADTGSSPVSYPVPTATALKAMFECVAFSENAYFQPQSVEICKPIVFRPYTTNYRGPLRKEGKRNFQVFATILENVCYKVHGRILSERLLVDNNNPRHQLQDVFMRRLKTGQFYTTPFLGWKEFVPSYFRPLREDTRADISINMTVPSILHSLYDKPVKGIILPRFVQNAAIREGVFMYAE